MKLNSFSLLLLATVSLLANFSLCAHNNIYPVGHVVPGAMVGKRFFDFPEDEAAQPPRKRSRNFDEIAPNDLNDDAEDLMEQ